MSDEEILKISYKKPHYFGELFNRHNKRFMKIAQKALRSRDDAEDVVQETFVRIYKYGKKASLEENKFRPWSNTILKNCLADQIKKYKNATASLTNEIENTVPDLKPGETALMGIEAISEINNKSYVEFVLKKIGGATAEILNLRYVLGKSFKEIAKILHIKNSAARVRVHRSKKIFMKIYKQFNNNYEY